jgi:RimJ/RimL family protein N-acetyltransferase
MPKTFVPADFDVPTSFTGPGFRMEPLGPEHNERDYEAWTSSMDHIRATPGFEDWLWPTPMTIEENLADLVRHAADFENRTGFTYSVLEGDDVIGCLYIYPSKDPGYDAAVRSWVRASRADMDKILWSSVSEWLEETWPFEDPGYAART